MRYVDNLKTVIKIVFINIKLDYYVSKYKLTFCLFNKTVKRGTHSTYFCQLVVSFKSLLINTDRPERRNVSS